MSNETEYDERTCITAGEMRAAGYPVPERIPDCAWVPRASIVPSVGGIRLDGDVLRGTITLRFTVPWSWLECEVAIDDVKIPV